MKTLLPLILFGMIALTGCQGAAKNDGPPVEDKDLLRSLVTQMPHASRDPARFQAFFAKDAAAPPESERGKYSRLYFNQTGTASVTGNTAVLKVKVTNDESSTPLGTVSWTFVKEGEQWKLKSAPLP